MEAGAVGDEAEETNRGHFAGTWVFIVGSWHFILMSAGHLKEEGVQSYLYFKNQSRVSFGDKPEGGGPWGEGVRRLRETDD